MNSQLLKQKYYYPIIGIFTILPWYLSSIGQKITTKSISVDSLGFYQSNICDVSFFKVVTSNINFRNIQFVGTNVEVAGPNRSGCSIQVPWMAVRQPNIWKIRVIIY